MKKTKQRKQVAIPKRIWLCKSPWYVQWYTAAKTRKESIDNLLAFGGQRLHDGYSVVRVELRELKAK